MKILIATPIYPPEIGGPATYIVEIVKRLRERHTLMVIAYTNSTEELAGSTLIPIRKDVPPPVRLFSFTKALIRAGRHADVIYVQNALAAGLPAVLAGLYLRKPVVLKFVGDEAWERATQAGKTEKDLVSFLQEPLRDAKTVLYMAIQGFVLRHASIVTTPSVYLGEAIHKAYRLKESQVRTNYNATDENTQTISTRQERQLVTIARLVPWKGIEMLIRVVGQIVPTHPDVSLFIAGEGPERERLEEIATSLGIKKSVTFTGTISKNNVHTLLSESSVFILNSTYEGLPHVVLESFATGTPVIATDIPGTNEVVIQNETGILVPVGNENALKEAIVKLIENSTERKRLAENARGFLHKKFTWERHIEVLESFFVSSKN